MELLEKKSYEQLRVLESSRGPITDLTSLAKACMYKLTEDEGYSVKRLSLKSGLSTATIYNLGNGRSVRLDTFLKVIFSTDLVQTVSFKFEDIYPDEYEQPFMHTVTKGRMKSAAVNLEELTSEVNEFLNRIHNKDWMDCSVMALERFEDQVADITGLVASMMVKFEDGDKIYLDIRRRRSILQGDSSENPEDYSKPSISLNFEHLKNKYPHKTKSFPRVYLTPKELEDFYDAVTEKVDQGINSWRVGVMTNFFSSVTFKDRDCILEYVNMHFGKITYCAKNIGYGSSKKFETSFGELLHSHRSGMMTCQLDLSFFDRNAGLYSNLMEIFERRTLNLEEEAS